MTNLVDIYLNIQEESQVLVILSTNMTVSCLLSALFS